MNSLIELQNFSHTVSIHKFEVFTIENNMIKFLNAIKNRIHCNLAVIS